MIDDEYYEALKDLDYGSYIKAIDFAFALLQITQTAEDLGAKLEREIVLYTLSLLKRR